MVIAWGAGGSRVGCSGSRTGVGAASVQTGVADVRTARLNAMPTHDVPRTFETRLRDARVAGEEVRAVPEILRRFGAIPGFGGME